MSLWERCKNARLDRWVVLFLIIFVLAESYNGRVGLRSEVVDGCTRSSERAVAIGLKYRSEGDIAVAQTIFQTIHRDGGGGFYRAPTPAEITAGCDDSFPHPSILPWSGR